MNRNKAKCERLKQIRKQLADRIGVDLHQSECTYRGECKGTCPKCAHEEKQLNQALAAKGMLVAGLATLSLGLAGCGCASAEAGDISFGKMVADDTW